MNFIVANDQVYCCALSFLLSLISSQSINIMQCPEFQSLLLLQPELADKDVPFRTKLCESIIKARESWFQALKKDLSVGFAFLTQVL